jgi:hypothetical protein
VATNLADAALVHLHTHSGWPVQRGPSILAQCGVTSRLRNQKIGHGLNEQTISQLWGIHQKAKVAEEFQPNGLRASRCPRWRPEPSTTKNPAGKPAGEEKEAWKPGRDRVSPGSLGAANTLPQATGPPEAGSRTQHRKRSGNGGQIGVEITVHTTIKDGNWIEGEPLFVKPTQRV